MTRMPRSIKIGHRVFSVIPWAEKAADASGARGNCQMEPPTIRIATYLKPFDKAEVMLHEVLHALWGDLPAESVSEEDAITRLAAGLSAAWVDNPNLIVWISESLKKK